MNDEIIIPRKKSKSIANAIGTFLGTLLMLPPILLYFVDFGWITADVPLFLFLLCILCAPICFWSFLYYCKQIFCTDPVLLVNRTGIHERISAHPVGMIKWEHIETIAIVPGSYDVYWICIILKHPQLYFQDAKLLNKLERRAKKWGHIWFSSIYFKKELADVANMIAHYHKQT